MSRWNISKIILYSHDERIRTVEFVPEEVNIITGSSNSGKTALLQIIDYCLGKSKCLVAQLVRDKCSWVAVVWKRGNEECFIARKMPAFENKTTHTYSLLSGTNLKIPTKSTKLKEQGKDILRTLEGIFGLTDVKSETYGVLTRDPVRISIRHIIPYILQSGKSIIDPDTLFVDAAGFKKQHIIDTMPYFLGVVEKNIIGKQLQLKALKRKLRSEERRLNRSLVDKNKRNELVDRTLSKGVELGLISQQIPFYLSEQLLLLHQVSDWKGDDFSEQNEGNELWQLKKREQNLSYEYKNIMAKKQDAALLQSDVQEFDGTVRSQRSRLESINLLKDHSSLEHCPICNSTLVGKNNSAEDLLYILKQLDRDLSDVHKQEPKINEYIEKLYDKADDLRNQLRRTREKIRGVIEQQDELAKLENLDKARHELIADLTN